MPSDPSTPVQSPKKFDMNAMAKSMKKNKRKAPEVASKETVIITLENAYADFFLNKNKAFWDSQGDFGQLFGYSRITAGGIGVATLAIGRKVDKRGETTYGSNRGYAAQYQHGNQRVVIDSILHWAAHHNHPTKIVYGHGIATYDDIPTYSPLEYNFMVKQNGGLEAEGDFQFIHGTYSLFDIGGLDTAMGFEHTCPQTKSEVSTLAMPVRHVWTLTKATIDAKYHGVSFVAMNDIEQHILKPEHMGNWAVRFIYWAQVPSCGGLMRIKAEMDAPVSNKPREFVFMSDDEEDATAGTA